MRNVRCANGGKRHLAAVDAGGAAAVSANESWRRIAICNFMAAQLETQGAQDRETKRTAEAAAATEAPAIQNKPI